MMDTVDKTSSSCPYAPQSVITLKMEGQPTTVTATVLELFQPFTMSCPMIVQIDDLQSSGLSGRYILKMYDRRFATDAREHARAEPWDAAIEERYRQFLQSDKASSFFEFCNNEPFSELIFYQEDWNELEREAYLQFACRKGLDSEVQVYQRLHDMQGIDIPQFFGQVLLDPLSNSPGLQEHYSDCPGILLEVIPGFPLTDIAQHAPRETWQDVCDNAIRIVNAISDRDIRNDDVKTRNVIVRNDGGSGHYRPVMIDFGCCVFREEGEEDRDWEHMAAIRDEEGAIGVVMQSKLSKEGGGFTYERSEKAKELTYKYMRIEDDHLLPDTYTAFSDSE